MRKTVALTKNQLRDDRVTLLAVRERIADKTERFICFALARHLRTMSTSQKLCQGPSHRRVRDWVEKALRHTTYYENWIQKYHPDLWEAATDKQRLEYARDARLRWIDWMVSQIDKDLQKLGDTLR